MQLIILITIFGALIAADLIYTRRKDSYYEKSIMIQKIKNELCELVRNGLKSQINIDACFTVINKLAELKMCEYKNRHEFKKYKYKLFKELLAMKDMEKISEGNKKIIEKIFNIMRGDKIYPWEYKEIQAEREEAALKKAGYYD